jgi:hypothetical protein
MSALEEYDDETIRAEVTEARSAVRWWMFLFWSGHLLGIMVQELTRLYIPGSPVIVTTQSLGFAIVSAFVGYGAYRLAEPWLLKRAAKRGYLEDTQ